VRTIPIEIRDASVEAIAGGIRQYLPRAIGIFVIGVPICLLATFAHFVLNASSSASTAGASVATVATVIQRIGSLLHR
jgi:hypothetical protein